MIDMRMGACTDKGRIRKINEDSYFSYRNENLTGGMVADGMGGHNAGEVASKMTAMIVKDCIIRRFNPQMTCAELGELIKCAFIEANAELYEYACHHPEVRGMGTTASMGFIYKNKLVAVHVGDSRIYSVSENSIRQVTTDHSYVQELLSRGQITDDAARNHPQKNLITRAIGSEPGIKVDVSVTDYNGETVFICSDGLSNLVSDEQILNVLKEHDDLQRGVEALVALANKKGGNDNITCLAFDMN